MKPTIISALIAGALAAGCAGTGTVGYHGTVTATTPDLVYVSPGVQVIADYDEPIFYSDNYYWRHDGGTWYRSSYYTGGWVHARPPRAVLTIDRPYAYARYRPRGYVARNRPVHRDQRPVYRDQRPVNRDHRQPVYRQGPTQVAPRTAPVVRDQRPVYRDGRDRRDDRSRRDDRDQRDDRDRDARDDRNRPVVRDHR